MVFTKKVYFGCNNLNCKKSKYEIKYVTGLNYSERRGDTLFPLSNGGGYVRNNPNPPIEVNLSLTIPRYVEGALENIRAISKLKVRYIYKDDNVSFTGKVLSYIETEEFDNTITAEMTIAEHREPDIKVTTFNSYNYASIAAANKKKALIKMYTACMFPVKASSTKASVDFKQIQQFLKKNYNYKGKLNGIKNTASNKAITLLRKKNRLKKGTNWDLTVARWFVKKYNKTLKSLGLLKKHKKKLKKMKVI